MKKIVILFIVFVVSLTLASCNAEEGNIEDYKFIYNAHEYTEYDSNGKKVSSTWSIPMDAKTKKVKIFYGIPDSKNKPNEKAKAYENPMLDMFLEYDDFVFGTNLCNKDFDFPDYTDIDKMEEIILVPNEEDAAKEAATRVVIKDKKDIEIIASKFTEASKAQNDSKFLNEAPKPNDYWISIKFYGIDALYEYGFICLAEDGHYGFNGQDFKNGYILYPFGEAETVLQKYDNWNNKTKDK